MAGRRAGAAGRGPAPTAPRGRLHPPDPTLREFQERIEALYGARDRARGLGGTFMWFVEEVGELSRALRSGKQRPLEAEFADVLAWLVTLASLAGVRMDRAIRKYAAGCPRCLATPCRCPRRRTHSVA